MQPLIEMLTKGHLCQLQTGKWVGMRFEVSRVFISREKTFNIYLLQYMGCILFTTLLILDFFEWKNVPKNVILLNVPSCMFFYGKTITSVLTVTTSSSPFLLILCSKRIVFGFFLHVNYYLSQNK